MKKIKILSIAIPTLVIFCFFVASIVMSCDSTTYQDISPVVDAPTYTKDIQPVISTKCKGCHSGGNEFPDLENYDQVKESSKTGKLLCKIKGECGQIMPTSGKMPQATIDMFQRWADQGYAKEITNPTYTKDIKPVMTANCTSCHSTSGKDDQPYLENYDQVKEATKTGTLLCRIDGSCGSVMPPTGGKLPQATIDMIKLWATNDYPN